MIFNQAQDTVNNSGMSQAEITAFNNKFLKYEGTQPGSVAKSAVNEIISSNADSSNPTVQAKINTDAATASPSTSDINNTKSYKITLKYGADGHVNEIDFEEQK